VSLNIQEAYFRCPFCKKDGIKGLYVPSGKKYTRMMGKKTVSNPYAEQYCFDEEWICKGCGATFKEVMQELRRRGCI